MRSGLALAVVLACVVAVAAAQHEVVTAQILGFDVRNALRFSATYHAGVVVSDAAPVAQSRDATAGAAGVEIHGVVTATETNLPLRNAEVEISGESLKKPSTVFTDDRGEYVFPSIAPGRYSLCAWKLGYVKSGYGEVGLTGPKPLVVGTTKLTEINFSLVRSGAIVATITDEYGEPVAGAVVNVFRASSAGDPSKLVHVNSNGNMPSTDDRGEVRLFNLAPGTYYVSAQRFPIPNFSAQRSTSEVFYPGTPAAAQAQPIRIASGQEVSISFSVLAVRLSRISGAILTSTGVPLVGGAVSLLVKTASGAATHPLSLSPDGSFVATDLAPGTYLLQVRPSGRGNPEYANEEIQVNGTDIEGIVVTTTPAATVYGRLAFDDESDRARFVSDSIRLSVKFSGFTVAPGRVSMANDGTFQVREVLGKGNFVFEDQRNIWFLDGVFLDGRDVADNVLDFRMLDGRTLEVRLTRHPSIISGSAGDARTSYVVVVFSGDSRKWRPDSRYVATARPDQQGRFVVAGLPAGEYLVAAIDRLEKGEEFNADFLDRLRSVATRIAVEKGATMSLILTVSQLVR